MHVSNPVPPIWIARSTPSQIVHAISAPAAAPRRELTIPASIGDAFDAAAEVGRAAARAFGRDHADDAWLFRSFVVRTGGFSPNGTEQAELAVLHRLQDARTPQDTEEALRLDKVGASTMWRELIDGSRLDAAAKARLQVTLDAALTFANDVAQTVKGASMRQRPFAIDPTLVPLGHIPGNNPSFPSGHATAAYTAAELLSTALPERRVEFMLRASEVAYSRLYGAMHFPSDAEAGARIGAMIGTYLAQSEHVAAAVSRAG